MADAGTEFLDFLKANHPEDYSKLSTDSASERLINTVLIKHSGQFNVWRSVPEWIRAKYNNRVPIEILERAKIDNNITATELAIIENKASQSYSSESNPDYKISFNHTDIAEIGAMAAAISKLKGYNAENAQKLAAHHQVRYKLLKNLKAKQQQNPMAKLSPQEKELYTQSRLDDYKTIKKEWIENHPERYAMHLLKKLNSGKIAPEQALPQLDNLLKSVNQKKRSENLQKLLQSPQSRYQRFSKENKELLTRMMHAHNLLPNYESNQSEKKQTPVKNTILQKALSKQRIYR